MEVFMHACWDSKVKIWSMCFDSFLFSFSHTLPASLHPAWTSYVIFLYPVTLSSTFLSSLPSNLRWPVATEALTDLLCHRLCRWKDFWVGELTQLRGREGRTKRTHGVWVTNFFIQDCFIPDRESWDSLDCLVKPKSLRWRTQIIHSAILPITGPIM